MMIVLVLLPVLFFAMALGLERLERWARAEPQSRRAGV